MFQRGGRILPGLALYKRDLLILPSTLEASVIVASRYLILLSGVGEYVLAALF